MSPSKTVRHRSRLQKLHYGDIWKTAPVLELKTKGVTTAWEGKQFTVSEGHVKSKGRYREGGPFFTYLVQPNIQTRMITLSGNFGVNHYVYDGPCHVDKVPSSNGGEALPDEDSSHLDLVGAEAIAATDPGNPNANFGVAMGEIIKDRRLPIPVINSWKKRTEVAKAASSEYLNAVFGWLPLVGEMKATAQSVKDGNVILENYRSSSGTLVHREFSFPDIESHLEVALGSGIINYGSGNVPGIEVSPVPVTLSRKTTVRRWFSGSYTHYADGGQSSLQKCLGIGSDADKLFGLTLTPDVIWELTPWSWAVDWFSNAGAVISNATSIGLAGLVMQYGYIMEETSIVDTYSMPGTGITGLSGKVPSSTWITTIKRRNEANPFGFGLSWDGLSPTQLAITAALGITRLR